MLCSHIHKHKAVLFSQSASAKKAGLILSEKNDKMNHTDLRKPTHYLKMCFYFFACPCSCTS